MVLFIEDDEVAELWTSFPLCWNITILFKIRSNKQIFSSYHMITMEKPTNIRKVLLIANIANVQKFISPSSKKC